MKMVYKHDGVVLLVQLGVDEKFTVGRNSGIAGLLLGTQHLLEFLANEIIEREDILLLRVFRKEINPSRSQCPVAKATERGGFYCFGASC